MISRIARALTVTLALAAGFASAATYSTPVGMPMSVVVPSAGSFTDYFEFNLSNASPFWSLSGVLTSKPIVIDFPAPIPDFTIPAVKFAGLELYHGTTLSPGAIEWGYTFNPTTSFASNTWSNLAAGNYFFKLTGTAPGAYGVYAVAMQAAPVPEPGEWAMILAGLGIVGVMARRRSTTI